MRLPYISARAQNAHWNLTWADNVLSLGRTTSFTSFNLISTAGTFYDVCYVISNWASVPSVRFAVWTATEICTTWPLLRPDKVTSCGCCGCSRGWSGGHCRTCHFRFATLRNVLIPPDHFLILGIRENNKTNKHCYWGYYNFFSLHNQTDDPIRHPTFVCRLPTQKISALRHSQRLSGVSFVENAISMEPPMTVIHNSVGRQQACLEERKQSIRHAWRKKRPLSTLSTRGNFILFTLLEWCWNLVL